MKRKVKTYRKQLALLTDRQRRQAKLNPKKWTNFFMGVRPFDLRIHGWA